MVGVIFINILFEKHEDAEKFIKSADESTGDFAKRFIGNVIQLKNADLIIMGYLVLVLVGSIIVLSFLGKKKKKNQSKRFSHLFNLNRNKIQ